MAAQERARLAEQKEKEAKAAAALAEAERRKSEEEAAIATAKLKELQQHEGQHNQQQQEKSQSAREKRDKILRELEGLPSELPTAAIPIMKSLDTPPPPPFDAMGLVAPRPQNSQQNEIQEQSTSAILPPPSFDIVEQMINTPTNSAPAPSAPPESPAVDHLEGVVPMPAPVLTNNVPPPPSFADFEHQLQQQHKPQQSSPSNQELTTDLSFDLDEVDGIPLSPSERQQMIAEQRQLYENIMKEKAANDAAIARISADAFDSRSAAARADERNERMDSMGRDLVRTTAPGGPKTEGEEMDAQPRFVKIGNNQTVALHGQERTKKAIKDGTAILVQCINCQNWMQVTATATLMFCPVCQVVCPVIPQNEVLTKEEAIQLTMDRKLAEKLQAEAYAVDDPTEKKTSQESGYFARLFGGAESSVATTTASSPGAAAIGGSSAPSWWDKISSIISYGVEEEHRERGDIGVTRPPGASGAASSVSTYPGQRRDVTLIPATVTGDRSPANYTNEETQGLLHPVVVNGNEANLPAGRVAEQRPLFSCVFDSVSNAASAVFSTGDAPVDEEGNVYGVDSRSLLAVTERGVGDGAGDYSQYQE
ncbi:hypothetical protein HJC23_009175 [Cyclotella cryptica]|uniref:Uncharacterized protein n=1 Tax=Cyclotella cryptica TaxID=29204 RepID=A0ABD3PL60_9STRA